MDSSRFAYVPANLLPPGSSLAAASVYTRQHSAEAARQSHAAYHGNRRGASKSLHASAHQRLSHKHEAGSRPPSPPPPLCRSKHSFQQELRHDVPPGRAQRLAHPISRWLFGHRNQHNVSLRPRTKGKRHNTHSTKNKSHGGRKSCPTMRWELSDPFLKSFRCVVSKPAA